MIDGAVSLAEPPAQDLDALAEALFRPMGAKGLFARTGLYESVVDALGALITRRRPATAETFRFPPVMTRQMIETSGYLKSFPNLLGCVSCLGGGEGQIRKTVARFTEGEDWTRDLHPADLVLTPAACYPIYPIAAARGPVPKDGLIFDVACDCFRREPSDDLDRLQSFRMREYVQIGSPAQINAFRTGWIEEAEGIAEALGLSYSVDLASDPFFGRGGQLMAASQVEQSLKFELLIPILSEDRPTACMSFNYHQDHFGQTWGLRDALGEVCHTGCVAFGMDRLAVALFAAHGVNVAKWPQSVHAVLAL